MDAYYRELIHEILIKKPDKMELSRLKTKLCKKHGLKKIPTDIQVLMHAEADDLVVLEGYLMTKPTRSMSGVAAVAIMTAPYECPHGKCLMCPGGPKSRFSSPQSYTGHEPATLRGIRNDYDPYLQVFNRLEQYVVTGHIPQKIELIIMGGTFPALSSDYQDSYIAYALKAMNDFSRLFFSSGRLDLLKFKSFFHLPGQVGDQQRVSSIKKSLTKIKGTCGLSDEQERNQSSAIRCVAMCVETRPDYCGKEQIDRMLLQGVTRVELGVQTVFDDVLLKIERGHTSKDSAIATKLLRDSFLKVGYHMMPGLPGSDEDRDLDMFRQIFLDPSYRPDALKIYPCMVVEGTGLYDLWKKGDFTPMDTKTALKLVVAIKEYVPDYCRIMRVQRDIPTKMIAAGVDRTNLRQMVKQSGVKCRCIRCREAGHVIRKSCISPDEIKMFRQDYCASDGTEIFLSFEDKERTMLFGFCRLRIPAEPFREEITPKSAAYVSFMCMGRR